MMHFGNVRQTDYLTVGRETPHSSTGTSLKLHAPTSSPRVLAFSPGPNLRYPVQVVPVLPPPGYFGSLLPTIPDLIAAGSLFPAIAPVADLCAPPNKSVRLLVGLISQFISSLCRSRLGPAFVHRPHRTLPCESATSVPFPSSDPLYLARSVVTGFRADITRVARASSSKTPISVHSPELGYAGTSQVSRRLCLSRSLCRRHIRVSIRVSLDSSVLPAPCRFSVRCAFCGETFDATLDPILALRERLSIDIKRFNRRQQPLGPSLQKQRPARMQVSRLRRPLNLSRLFVLTPDSYLLAWSAQFVLNCVLTLSDRSQK